jgi:RNA polymerase sigma-70 factor (ECF subfamily)
LEVTAVSRPAPDTDALLTAAGRGDRAARDQLFDRHRNRLRRMVAIRLDHRLAARVDPSDVVQETLFEAAGRLDAYLHDRPIPFYPWLRQLAYDRITDAHRRHVQAGRRSVNREVAPTLSNASVLELADRLLAAPIGPSTGSRRSDRRAQVRDALNRLPDRDREVLVLRHLEQLSTREAAAVLNTSEGAVKVRLLRALQRLRSLLDSEGIR